jgi:hypothetical protein
MSETAAYTTLPSVADAGGAWKQTLARELKAAGYEIDWNVVMQ